jgi:NADH-quinone oxidoreductase subunit G
MEGRPQYCRKVVEPLKNALDDRQVFLEIAAKLGLKMPFSDLATLRKYMSARLPIFNNIGQITKADIAPIVVESKNLDSAPLAKIVSNYYMSNVISRASPTMLECAKFILGQGGL